MVQTQIRHGQPVEEVLATLQGGAAQEVGECDRRVERMVSLIRSENGATSMRWLADAVGLSGRQLERLARDTLGLSPKTFARVTRLQSVVRRMIAAKPTNLAEVAAEFHYTDQTHMTREFAALAQLTPAAYQRMIEDVGFVLDPTAAPR